MREKWDRQQSGSTYGAITVQNAVNTCRGGYDPGEYFRQQAAREFMPTPAGPLSLVDMAPEDNRRLRPQRYRQRQSVCGLGTKRKPALCRSGNNGTSMTGKSGSRTGLMQLCKKLADALYIYALSIKDEARKGAYMKHVGKWQSRHNRETILKDAASVYPVPIAEFDTDPFLFNCLNGTLDLRTREFRPHSPGDLLSLISA